MLYTWQKIPWVSQAAFSSASSCLCSETSVQQGHLAAWHSSPSVWVSCQGPSLNRHCQSHFLSPYSVDASFPPVKNTIPTITNQDTMKCASKTAHTTKNNCWWNETRFFSLLVRFVSNMTFFLAAVALRLMKSPYFTPKDPKEAATPVHWRVHLAEFFILCRAETFLTALSYIS